METGDIEAARAGAEAILAVEAAAEEAARRQREAATDWRSGVRRGLAEYAREAAQAADQAEAALTGAFRGMKDALVAFVQTGKLSFASLVDAILAGLARMAIRQAILAPFLNALGLGLSPPALTGTVPPAPVSPNLGVFHRGGLVGVPGCITRTGLPPTETQRAACSTITDRARFLIAGLPELAMKTRTRKAGVDPGVAPL